MGHLYASFAYDAVWAIGLALNATVAKGFRVEDFAYNDTEIAEQLRISMEDVKFKGISVSKYRLIHCISCNTRFLLLKLC